MAPPRLGMTMIDNFNRFVLSNIDVLAHGLWITLYICAVAFSLGLVLGLVACLVRLYVPFFRYIAIAYIEFCRATPILVQLLWVNYVWPELFGFPSTVTGAGIIALALQSSGYVAETLRSGFEGLPKGQIESARAVGMRFPQILRRITLPQVLLVVAPSLINQVAVVIKSSTLISVISIPDLMYESLKIVNRWYEPIEILTSVAFIYFIMIFAISAVINKAARNINRKLGIGTL
jgi:polar amino acid transport system permease protein